MTLWAYGIATVGFFSGLYIMLRFKKWRLGAWIACLALAIFAGTSINISNLISMHDAFKYQVSAISNEVARLNVQMNQSLVLTQQINHTVNLVTEVKKEVTDVREMIAELYSRTRSEFIKSTDTNRLCFYDKPDGGHIAFIRLQRAPIPPSVSVVSKTPDAAQIPILANSLRFYRNTMSVDWDIKVGDYRKCAYVITYVIDPNTTNLCDEAGFEGRLLYSESERFVNVNSWGSPR